MKKSILNLKGAQQLSKVEQKSINGGRYMCNDFKQCPINQVCIKNTCYPDLS